MFIVQQKFENLSFANRRVHILDIPRRLHQRVGIKKRKFVTIHDVEICEATWYMIVEISRYSYLSYKQDNKCKAKATWKCWNEKAMGSK